MSILIKGMEMPKNCEECAFNYDMFRCMITLKSTMLADTERLSDCPLIELPPHGRLIDADALIAMCKTMEQIEWNNKAAPYSWAYAYESFESDIDDAPTIIESEE